MIVTVGKRDIKKEVFGETSAAAQKQPFFVSKMKRRARPPAERSVRRAPPSVHLSRVNVHTHKHSFTCRHTQTHVYSTRNPRRSGVIDSAERRIAHCDKSLADSPTHTHTHKKRKKIPHPNA